MLCSLLKSPEAKQMKKATIIVVVLFAVIPVPVAAIAGIFASIFNTMAGLVINTPILCDKVESLVSGKCEDLQPGCRAELVSDGFFMFKFDLT